MTIIPGVVLPPPCLSSGATICPATAPPLPPAVELDTYTPASPPAVGVPGPSSLASLFAAAGPGQPGIAGGAGSVGRAGGPGDGGPQGTRGIRAMTAPDVMPFITDLLYARYSDVRVFLLHVLANNGLPALHILVADSATGTVSEARRPNLGMFDIVEAFFPEEPAKAGERDSVEPRIHMPLMLISLYELTPEILAFEQALAINALRDTAERVLPERLLPPLAGRLGYRALVCEGEDSGDTKGYLNMGYRFFEDLTDDGQRVFSAISNLPVDKKPAGGAERPNHIVPEDSFRFDEFNDKLIQLLRPEDAGFIPPGLRGEMTSDGRIEFAMKRHELTQWVRSFEEFSEHEGVSLARIMGRYVKQTLANHDLIIPDFSEIKGVGDLVEKMRRHLIAIVFHLTLVEIKRLAEIEKESPFNPANEPRFG